MKIFFLLAILVSFAYVKAQHMGKSAEGLEIFKIDLDLDPEDRFVEPTAHFKEAALELFNVYEEVISNAINYMFKALDMITWSRYNEKLEEMEGIADTLEKSTNEVMMMNFLYELDAYCTTIVVRQGNGDLCMLRNLDFYFPNETRKTLYIGKFYRGGRYLFEAPMFAGIVGIYTAYRPQAFALAINERNPKNNDMGFMQNLGMMFSGFTQISYLARQVMQECTTYECAYNRLQSKTLIAGCYLILVGMNQNEGAIISRERTSTLNIEKLNDTNWYLAQTNQDHFAGICPIRCQKARERIDLIGNKTVSPQNLLEKVMTQWPNLNYQTIYNSVYQMNKNISQTFYLSATDLTDPGDLNG
eukprot:403375054